MKQPRPGPSASQVGPQLSEEEIRRAKRLEAAVAREKEARLERERLAKEQEDAKQERLRLALDAPPALKKGIASPPPVAPTEPEIHVDEEAGEGEEEETKEHDPLVDANAGAQLPAPAPALPPTPASVAGVVTPAPVPPSVEAGGGDSGKSRRSIRAPTRRSGW